MLNGKCVLLLILHKQLLVHRWWVNTNPHVGQFLFQWLVESPACEALLIRVPGD